MNCCVEIRKEKENGWKVEDFLLAGEISGSSVQVVLCNFLGIIIIIIIIMTVNQSDHLMQITRQLYHKVITNVIKILTVYYKCIQK